SGESHQAANRKRNIVDPTTSPAVRGRCRQTFHSARGLNKTANKLPIAAKMLGSNATPTFVKMGTTAKILKASLCANQPDAAAANCRRGKT
ncbi:MAG TPA: hypothetical protein VGJ15_00720, partial [Pirellulales bacterium]